MSELTFMPLLNSIAVNERKGEILFDAWADATQDAALAQVLRFVAIREGEHAMAFTKRMCELGEAVCEETAYQVFKNFDDRLALLRSPASDAEKVACMTRGESEDERDIFGGFFKDTTIDPETGALLGRFIAEERDTGRRLRAEYARICGAAATPQSDIDELRACIDALRRDIAELKGLRSVA